MKDPQTTPVTLFFATLFLACSGSEDAIATDPSASLNGDGLRNVGMFNVPAIGWTASGVYVGPNLVVTNAHVVRNGAEVVRPPLVLPPFRLSGTGESKDVASSLVIDETMDLAAVALTGSPWPTRDVPCITHRALRKGEPVSITSHPAGAYPAVVANGIVTEPEARLTRDPDPQVPDELRAEVYSIVVHLDSEQSERVKRGSSGGAVVDAHGQLVGLVWSGEVLSGGSTVLVAPASVWLERLTNAIAAGQVEGVAELVQCSVTN